MGTQTTTEREALRARLAELAADVGRLGRQTDPETSLGHLADRIAGHVTDLILIVEPSAAEIAAQTYPGDEQTVAAAIDYVDARKRRLQYQLGRDDG